MEKLEEMTLPRVSSWINAENGKTLRGVVVENNNVCGDDGRNNRCEFDVCPICFKAWTSDGLHRICSLPCGHMYGMSCIKTWLKRSQSCGRCPQCNGLCTLKDVRLLYATRLCLAEHKASTTRFPFTKHGARAFNRYIKRLRFDTLELRVDALERQDDAFKSQLQELKHQAVAQADVFKRLAYKLGRRAKELRRRVDECTASMDFFNQSYEEHKRLKH